MRQEAGGCRAEDVRVLVGRETVGIGKVDVGARLRRLGHVQKIDDEHIWRRMLRLDLPALLSQLQTSFYMSLWAIQSKGRL